MVVNLRSKTYVQKQFLDNFSKQSFNQAKLRPHYRNRHFTSSNDKPSTDRARKIRQH